jgi:putative nucleotidyltransferase with HDIG domain
MSAHPPAHRGVQLASLSFAQVAGVLAVAILAAAVRAVTPAQLPVALVTAIVITVLDRFPLYLNPIGEMPLAGVITIPVLVLFGWPAAIVGTALALVPSLAGGPLREGMVRGAERIIGLGVAAAAAGALHIAEPYAQVIAVAVAALALTVTHTLTAAAALHLEEGITWPRALSYLAETTLFHYLVVLVVAAATVWAAGVGASAIDRLLVPAIGAGVTLQIYLPRILRGQEQRRILAAVSVLAAAVDAKDPYTADHSQSVARLCRRVARVLGLREAETYKVYLAALLHDVGKTVVPPEVLRKAGALTPQEREVINSHVEAGVRIVRSIRGLSEIAPLVEASHERLDGRGYPRGLSGDEIPLASRIILAVDAYNAITTDRTYRPASPPAAALAELDRHAGTQFDPQVIAALRIALGVARPARAPAGQAAWIRVLRRPAFALLWIGELVSFIGDEIFFIALSLWVYRLTGSITMLAVTLVAAQVGQGLLGLFAGALADRIDRRRLIVVTDACRAALVAVLPFVLPRSIPAGIVLLVVLNVGTVFFRSAAFALIPTIVPREDLLPANALFQATGRIAEVIGGVLGGMIVVTLGYHIVFYLDAASFVVGAACVAGMPVAWRAGLSDAPSKRLSAEIREGLVYIWQTPLHRALALLIVPGYLTLAFTVLQTPMVVRTAGLSAVAYGAINSAMGVGKLVAAAAMTGTGRLRPTVAFIVLTYLVTDVAIVLFGSSTLYSALMAAAILFGVGNMAATILNATLSLGNVPSHLAGRLMASRQAFIAGTTVLGMLVFGRLADVAGPPKALLALGGVSSVGVLIVWLLAGRYVCEPVAAPAPGPMDSRLDRA